MKHLIAFLFFGFSLLLAQGATTPVSSITCTGQTATVNSTAHGLAASQGFSLSGTSARFNSTITSASANSFTFVLPTGTPCSGFTSGYNAVQAAKQIINTNSIVYPASGTVSIFYLFWFTTTIPIVPACAPSCASAWAGANAAENAALSAGTTVEFAGSIMVAASTSAATIETQVQNQYTTSEVAYTNFLLSGAGFWWNGTAWVNQ